MSKTAFVTGSTGFLGLNLIELLLEKGWKVYALHRKSSDLTYLNRYDVEKVVGDITDIESLRSGIPDGVDVLFHVAVSTNYWKKNNALQTKINVQGTNNVIEVVLEKSIPRMVHTSSITTYGLPGVTINENTPSNALESISNYFVTKKQSEDAVQAAIEKRGLDAVIVCPSHIMGPYDFQNWVQMIHLVYNNSLPGVPPGKGPFSHVKEVAQAHITAAETAKVGERYVLGGVYMSFLELINKMQEKLDRKKSKSATPRWVLGIGVWWYAFLGLFTPSKEPDLTPEKLMIVSADIQVNDSKAQQELGFKHIPADEILEDCITWLKNENMFGKSK